jgi:NADPH-dependent 7-cyano-7-deazaguanine reductase QueF-like protein
MNRDYDWMNQIFKDYIYGKADSIWIDEAGTDMWNTYNKSYYNDTRGDEVATAVLEAYSKGIEFDTLLEKNKQVRAYWGQIQADKVRQAQDREKRRERDRKLAEKRKLAAAAKAEVMAKLTPEELEAFGFAKKPRKVTKR